MERKSLSILGHPVVPKLLTSRCMDPGDRRSTSTRETPMSHLVSEFLFALTNVCPSVSFAAPAPDSGHAARKFNRGGEHELTLPMASNLGDGSSIYFNDSGTRVLDVKDGNNRKVRVRVCAGLPLGEHGLKFARPVAISDYRTRLEDPPGRRMKSNRTVTLRHRKRSRARNTSGPTATSAMRTSITNVLDAKAGATYFGRELSRCGLEQRPCSIRTSRNPGRKTFRAGYEPTKRRWRSGRVSLPLSAPEDGSITSKFRESAYAAGN